MELFSKRNINRVRRASLRFEGRETGKFISETLRNRLKEELKYVIHSNKFLESFLVVNNERRNDFYLHSETLRNLSLRELGYDITTIIDPDDLEFRTSTEEVKYLDARFFDFIELIIIFAKKESRDELVARLESRFLEEGGSFSIHGYMIVEKENDGLRSVIGLIKEKNLQEKIKEYYQTRVHVRPDYRLLAKTSADIVQLLFSSPTAKKQTKRHAEDLCQRVAARWTEKSKSKELAALFSDTVKNAKDLSNQIENVRHTDRTTIPVDSPNLYKLVSVKNINIAELVILTLPENYISMQDPEGMKLSYFERYQISKTTGWIIKKKEQGDLGDIDPEDIPF